MHSEDNAEEEELEEMEVPQTGRDHIDTIMDLNEETDEFEKKEANLMNGILKDLKRLYDQTIKPIEKVYKYGDITTRRFAGKCIKITSSAKFSPHPHMGARLEHCDQSLMKVLARKKLLNK